MCERPHTGIGVERARRRYHEPADARHGSPALAAEGDAEAFGELAFERFSQLDTSATRTARGVGLGLAICKSLVEAHAGEIGVVSPPQATDALTPGRGSLFWLTLPA